MILMISVNYILHVYSQGIDQLIEDSCPQIISALRSIISCESISTDIREQVFSFKYLFLELLCSLLVYVRDTVSPNGLWWRHVWVYCLLPNCHEFESSPKLPFRIAYLALSICELFHSPPTCIDRCLTETF